MYVTPAFPKLIYVLYENNCLKGGKYDYLTKLAVKCSAKRMYPDYISARLMRENYEGNVFSPMGCRSFLSPWKDEEGNYLIDNINQLNVNYFNTFDGIWVLGLTPHSLYTRRAEALKCDTLIVDEAGQMTIPLGLMGMIRADKVIFAGDHKQLPPIISSEEIKEEMTRYRPYR